MLFWGIVGAVVLVFGGILWLVNRGIAEDAEVSALLREEEKANAEKLRAEQKVVLRPERCQTCKWWAEETNLEHIYYRAVLNVIDNEKMKRACCVNPAGGKVKMYDHFCKQWEQRGG